MKNRLAWFVFIGMLTGIIFFTISIIGILSEISNNECVADGCEVHPLNCWDGTDFLGRGVGRCTTECDCDKQKESP